MVDSQSRDRLATHSAWHQAIDHRPAEASEITLRNIGWLLETVSAIVEPIHGWVHKDIENRGPLNFNELKTHGIHCSLW